MDLLQTVRKEGSRGGVNFSWDDVKSSQHRENYLGHSLMAPVGRWQKNKDLSWYAKAEDAELTPEERAEKERQAKREEMRKIKEAEEDAMAKALGLPVPDRSNANLEPLAMNPERQKEVNLALKEALADEDRGGCRGSHGESRPSKSGRRRRSSRERNEKRRDYHEEESRRSARRTQRPTRSRSRSRSRARDVEGGHRRRQYRSPSLPRSWAEERQRRSRSRDRSRDRKQHRDRQRKDRGESRSPERDRISRQRRDRSRARSRSRSPYDRRRRRDG